MSDRTHASLDTSGMRQQIEHLEGGWTDAWQSILERKPELLAAYISMASVPEDKARLDRKSRELIALAVDAAATHLQPEGIRVHVRNALTHGASPEEIVEVVEMTSTLGVHSLNLGVPLLMEVLEETGQRGTPPPLDDYQEKLKTRFTSNRGYWHEFWNELLELDPEFFEAYTDFSSVPWETGILSPKMKELVYIAFDSAATHLYIPGWKLHIRNALGHGATSGEILETMEIASLLGMKTATATLPILDDELARRTKPSATDS